MKSGFLFTVALFLSVCAEAQPFKILKKKGHEITCLSFSPDSRFVATGGLEQSVVLWDLSTMSSLNVFKGHKDVVLSIAFSPNGELLASGSKDNSIILWSPGSGMVYKKLEGHLGPVTTVLFTSNGKQVISSSTDQSFFVWNVQTGEKIKEVKAHTQAISSLALGKGDSLLATGSFDGTINYWNLKTYQEVKTLNPQGGKVHAVAFHRDKKMLAAGLEDKTIKIYNLESNSIAFTLRGHKDEVYKLEYSANGEYLVSSSLDNSVKIWNAFTGEEVKGYTHFYDLVSPSFSPDNRLLATGELTDELKLWDLSTLNTNPTAALNITNKKVSNPTEKPTIEIVQPKLERGKKVLSLEKEMTIKGTIQTSNGIYELLINGEEVPITSDNNFSHTIRLAYSDNEISIIAKDIFKNVTKESFTVERQVKVQANDTMGRTGKDYALVIGTDLYDQFPKLSNPVNDASTISKELKESYGFDVELIQNPARSELYSALRSYGKRQFADDDQLFIFIAGHGEFDPVFSDGYVVTKDSKLKDENKETFISHSNLRTIVGNIPCKHILLVMDVCFGGTFDPLRGSLEDDKGYKDMEKNKFIRKKLEFITRKYITSGGKEYVPDGRPGYHSPFAFKFLEALRNYGGEDGIITFNELYGFVEKAQPGPKTGGFGNNQPGSDFLFIKKKK